MKTSYILLCIFLFSCGSSTQKDKNQTGAIEQIDGVPEARSAGVVTGFPEILATSKSKKLPHVEQTSFDSFSEEEYAPIDARALKLDQVYPELNLEDRPVRPIDLYTLPIREGFHSLVVTVLKNEQEMETWLINYNAEGNIIDHERVAYDEIAESMSRVVARISENQLTVLRKVEGPPLQIEQIEFEIRWDGTLEKVETQNLNETFPDFILIDAVLKDLGLDWVQTKTSLIQTRVYPENPTETFLIIPEVVDEGEQYFELNSHILIADNRTGKITHRFFESNQSNHWVSDAIELREISLDTALLQLSEETKAYGIQVGYIGMSRVNPYSNQTWSLFIKSGDTLEKILSNYSLKDSSGEWDGHCAGEFISKERIVFPGTHHTQGYQDLWVNLKITESKAHENEEEDCLTENSYHIKHSMLKFDGKTYQEVEEGFETLTYSQILPRKLTNFQRNQFQVNQAFEVNGQKIITGNYIPEKGSHYTSSSESQFDWGDRFLLLNKENELIFQSPGFGDLYLFEPHFYQNPTSDQLIIICQKAFEYPFGGEVFILDESSVKHIGTLDIEGPEGENFLTEMVAIQQVGNSLVFAIKSNQLTLKPGEEISTQVTNAIYVYQGKQLILKTTTP